MKYIQGIITGASLMLCFFLMVGAKQDVTEIDKLSVNELTVKNNIEVISSQLRDRNPKFVQDDPWKLRITSIGINAESKIGKKKIFMSLGASGLDFHQDFYDGKVFDILDGKEHPNFQILNSESATSMIFRDEDTKSMGFIGMNESDFKIWGYDTYGKPSFHMSSGDGDYMDYKN